MHFTKCPLIKVINASHCSMHNNALDCRYPYVYVVLYSLMEQLKRPRCKAVVGILNASQSKQLIKWRHLVRLTFCEHVLDRLVGLYFAFLF